MDIDLSLVLGELERFGLENDARATDRRDKFLNITRDTGEFLLVLIRAIRARNLLEIGTSNGYSTLWLAHAVRPLGGRVETVEARGERVEMARANLVRAGLEAQVDLHEGDAGALLSRLADAHFDLVFLDAERSRYVGYWPDVQRVLRSGGMVVVDNAISHESELAEFAAQVKRTPDYLISLVPVGKGELLILKDESLPRGREKAET